MPRGQKSKLRAREKHHQAVEVSTNLVGAQAIAKAGGEPRSSVSSHFKGNSRRSGAAITTSNPRGPLGAPPMTTTAAAIPYRRSNERGNNQVEERPRSLQAQVATGDFPRSPLDEKVIISVHYLLHKYQKNEPITKAEILKNIIQMHKSHFPEILKKASEHLELLFGLHMKEMDPYKHIFVLINKLALNPDEKLSDGGGVPMTGLLMAILGVIFTKGNRATEDQVWKILNAMGLYEGKEHCIFGEPRKLITKDLVKEEYLEYRQVPNSDPPCYEFLWGPRAHVETTKMKVLEFLAKVHNTIPSAFQPWYEEALTDEEDRAQAKVAARAPTSAIISARSRGMSTYSSHLQ